MESGPARSGLHASLLHLVIARWRSRLDGVTSAEEVRARVAAGRVDMDEARCTRCGLEFPDIARTLFLSRKTVERHVSSILGKLEVKNRAQLGPGSRSATEVASTEPPS